METSSTETSLSIHSSSMPDPHDDNHHSVPVDTVNHAIVAHANPKMISLTFELLTAWRKRIFAERGRLLRDSPLQRSVKRPEFSQG
jgi:hypothetical protein